MATPFKDWFKYITSGPVAEYYKGWKMVSEGVAIMTAASSTIKRSMSHRGVKSLLTKIGEFRFIGKSQSNEIKLPAFKKALKELGVLDTTIKAAEIRSRSYFYHAPHLKFFPSTPKDQVIEQFVLNNERKEKPKRKSHIMDLFFGETPPRVDYSSEIYSAGIKITGGRKKKKEPESKTGSKIWDNINE